jgi:thymidylate kinase
MLVFFEGVEKVGKTTIAKMFIDEYEEVIYYKSTPCNIRNSNNIKKTIFEIDFLLQLEKYNPDKVFIIDRSIWTEYAYSKLFHRHTDVKILKSLTKKLNKNNVQLFYFYCDNSRENFKRFVNEKSILFSENEKLKKYFDEALKVLKIKKMYKVDTEMSKLDTFEYVDKKMRSL